MDEDMKKWISIFSIVIALAVILMLMLAGFDISGISINKGIRIG